MRYVPSKTIFHKFVFEGLGSILVIDPVCCVQPDSDFPGNAAVISPASLGQH